VLATVIVFLAAAGVAALLRVSFPWLGDWPRVAGLVILFFCATTAMRLMARDPRPLAGFGLRTGNRWQRSFAVAMIAAALAAGTVVLVGGVAGSFGLMPGMTAGGILWAAVAGLIAGAAIAYLQEIVFRGLIATEFDVLVGWASPIVTAVAFAGSFVLLQNAGFGSTPAPASVATVFLAGIALGLARQVFGGVIVPIGLAWGWLSVQFPAEAILTRVGSEAGESLSIYPVSLGAPGSWIAMGGAIALFLMLRLGASGAIKDDTAGAKAPLSENRLAKAFALVNPVSNPACLAPVDLWAKRLRAARFRVGFIYWPRLVATLLFSTISTIVNMPERFLAPRLLARRQVQNPVVIVGVHRSGTTYLHELLSLDDQFAIPRNSHVGNPTGFLVFGRLTTFAMAVLMPWHRPMDGMDWSIDSPAEDEFAIAYSSGLSPVWGLGFPRDRARYERLIYPDTMTAAERGSWKQSFLLFLRKLTAFNHRRPLLKSPFHLTRLSLITEVFAQARFIHIYRNPLRVYQSHLHLQETLFPMFQMQTPGPDDSYAEHLLRTHYVGMEDTYSAAAAQLPDDQISEIRFEDLVADPAGEVARIYRELGLTMSETFRRRLERSLVHRKAYTRNKLPDLPDAERARVAEALTPLLKRWHYPIDGHTPAPRRVGEAAVSSRS
jgi:membrane protease YdiL (CAAX protease family)